MSKQHREESRAERAAAALLAQERRERVRRAWIVGGVVSAVRPGIEGLTFRQWTVNATSQMSKDGATG